MVDKGELQRERTFTKYATVQNKMHYVAQKNTSAEIIYKRVDSNKENIGMTNFKGDYITKPDIGGFCVLSSDEINI